MDLIMVLQSPYELVGTYDQFSNGGHFSSVNSLDFLSNNVTFASGSNDNNVKIWLNYEYYTIRNFRF